ncbi:hypothetical protein Taro_035147 [Colocasia esculenta]|uniref:Uncharacterized protein n=1 Tax=Colocasia esculenta TaxID=4460 RepID=A0A843VZN3_COLES|nr:hypothetical protein [Colocasia esculenta]
MRSRSKKNKMEKRALRGAKARILATGREEEGEAPFGQLAELNRSPIISCSGLIRPRKGSHRTLPPLYRTSLPFLPLNPTPPHARPNPPTTRPWQAGSVKPPFPD